jgi:hypothetical protein
VNSIASIRAPSATGLIGWLLLALFAAALAVFFGLLASTANPILVGLGAGLLVGAMLLAKPVWNIWLLLLTGLLVVGVLPIWVEGLAGKAVWGVSVLGFVLLLRALFQVVADPQARRATPAFVWVGLIFLLYTLINTLAHWPEAYQAFSGFKRYFQVIGLMFALAWLTIDERSVTHWRKLFVFVALIQLPWAAYELIKLVPIREGLAYAYPGIVPIDVVAGTFGANMTSGGANAEMATFLIIMLLFLLARLRSGALPKGRLLWLAPIILAPLFMGETKAVVVLLPLAFLTLYRRELLVRPHFALVGLLAGALLTVAAGYAYLTLTKKTLEAQVAETLSYNVYEKGYGGYALNRTTVLSFWAERQGLHDPAGAVFGHGLGSAHDATGGHVARRYPGYGIGLTAASTLLWEQGVFGTALFLAMLALAWRAAGRVQKAAREAWVKADAAAIQAALPLFAFFLIYRVALLEGLPFQLVFYGLLGYLAWLVRQQTRRPS